MHSPRPYGRFGPELNTQDEGAADALMRRTLNLKSQLGVQSLRLTRALPGGGVATAIDMGVKFGPKLVVAAIIVLVGYMAGRWAGAMVGR